MPTGARPDQGPRTDAPIASVSIPSAWIIILAVLLRAAVMVRGSGAFDDPDNYLPMARSLASGEGFSFKGRPTAYRPPLYPLMLVPAVAAGDWAPWGIALVAPRPGGRHRLDDGGRGARGSGSRGGGRWPPP